MKTTIAALVALSACISLPAAAQTTVKDAWIRGTVAQQKATGMFAQIPAAQGGKLVSASSPAAGVVEVHEMKMDGDVMQMRKLEGGLEIAPGATVELKPGSFHGMLTKLKESFAKDGAVKANFTFEKAGDIEVELVVEDMGATESHAGHE